MTAGGEGHVWA